MLHARYFLVVAVCAAAGLTAIGASSTFTYQGELRSNGTPINASADLRVGLWDDPSAGNQIGTTLEIDNISVARGLFTTTLDFGPAAFSSGPRWLQIAVRSPAGSGTFTTLTPRQPVTPAPLALFAAGPWITGTAGLSYSSGNVGVGRDSTQTALEIYRPLANGLGPVLRLTGGGGNGAEAALDLSTYDPGNNDPSARIVAGDNNFSSDLDFQTKAPGAAGNLLNTRMRITAVGQVGIGTTSPGSSLEVNGGVRARGGAPGGYGVNDNGYAFGSPGDQDGGMFSSADGQVEFYTNAAERMRIDSSGRVGINTTDLPRQLNVNGDVGISGGVVASGLSSNGQVYAAVGNTNAVYATSSGGYPAVYAENGVDSVDAIYGNATAGSGNGAGVGGAEGSPHGWGLFAYGDSGASGLKLFHIDHPLAPTQRYLNHFSAEGPEPLDIYSGVVTTDDTGVAWVALPGYFEALNRDFRYQLTVVDESDDTFAQAKVWRKIADNKFAIRTSAPRVEVQWQVTGVRNDPAAQRALQAKGIEQDKVGDAIGKYLEPALYGQPPEMGERYHRPAATGKAPALAE